MINWKSYGHTVHEIGPPTKTIAVCNASDVATKVAALPQLLDVTKNLLSAYEDERNGLISVVREAEMSGTANNEMHDLIMLMNEMIRKTKNAIASAEGKEA